MEIHKLRISLIDYPQALALSRIPFKEIVAQWTGLISLQKGGLASMIQVRLAGRPRAILPSCCRHIYFKGRATSCEAI
jgi:hypothetical protein